MDKETGTVRLHRVIRAPTDIVYRAFTEKAALEYWLSPHGFTGEVYQIDVRVGGGYHMSFSNFRTGVRHSFAVTFVELQPNRRICHRDRFDDPDLDGDMLVSIDLKPVLCGCDLQIVQSGIPAVIPVEMCYLGWQESLQQLANLVEPDIPEN